MVQLILLYDDNFIDKRVFNVRAYDDILELHFNSADILVLNQYY